MTLIEVRQRISDLGFKAGSIKKWAEKKGLAYGHVYKIVRGEATPGNTVLRALKIRPVVDDKAKEPRYEDV